MSITRLGITRPRRRLLWLMKRTHRQLISAALLLVLCACGGASRGSKSPPTGGNSGGIPADANAPAAPTNDPFPYTLVGRFDRATNPNVARMDWSNSMIGARFTGSSLSVKIDDESTNLYGGTTPVQNVYDVVIDGAAPQVLEITKGKGVYTLASGLAGGTHTVWLTKRTEAQIGISDFGGFVLANDGQFMTPPSAPTRVIEVVGSSETTGYGADANVTAATMCGFTTATENADDAYPKLAADAFQSALVNISFSGKGVGINLAPGDRETIPVLETRTLAGDSNVHMTTYAPADVVIIDAGGDDLVGAWGAGVLDTNVFLPAYVGLVKNIRAQEPNAIIFSVLTAGGGGTDPQTLGTALQTAVQTVNQSGDPNVFYFAFQPYDPSVTGYGCDYHPNRAAASILAQQIGAVVKAKTGW